MKRKCNFRKSDGSRCGADAQSGKPLCVFHDPAKAAAGHKARRRGGINRHRPATVLPLETPDHPLRNTQDVSPLLAESINQVRKGQLDLRMANAMGYLTGILLGVLQQGSFGELLVRIEATLEHDTRM